MSELRMKDLCGRLLAVLCMLCVCVSFSSCKDDDDEEGSSLLGYWMMEDEFRGSLERTSWNDLLWFGEPEYANSTNAEMYHFVNSNTVELGHAFLYKVSQSENLFTASVDGHSVYVVWRPRDIGRTYTYVVEGNKIIITNGDILTISDNILLKDGGSGTFEKVKEN